MKGRGDQGQRSGSAISMVLTRVRWTLLGMTKSAESRLRRVQSPPGSANPRVAFSDGWCVSTRAGDTALERPCKASDEG